MKKVYIEINEARTQTILFTLIWVIIGYICAIIEIMI